MQKKFEQSIPLYIFVLTLLNLPLGAENLSSYEKQKKCLQAKIQDKKYKEALSNFDTLLLFFPSQRGDIFLNKAICYAQNQEIEKSLKNFLKALEAAPVSPQAHTRSLIYEKALETLLKSDPQDLKSKGKNILFEFYSYYKKHERDYALGLIMAYSYALLEDYPLFFQLFYSNYKHCSDHFLVDRLLGQIYLQLTKVAQHSAEKEEFREKAFYYFSKALEKNPKDALLYRLSYLLASNEQKKDRLEKNLALLIQSDAVLNRVDIFPYVREALHYGYLELTEQLINKAKTWYPVSRSLQAAEHYYYNYREKYTNEGVI